MIRLVVTTFANSGEAAAVVRTLVEEKLAACGTIVPGARSIYVWEGRLEDNEEAVVWFKTSAEKLSALVSRLEELHPYDTPEILSFVPGDVPAKYAAWVTDQVG